MKNSKDVKSRDRKAQHKQDLDAYLSTLLADEDKCRDFMRQVEKIKTKKRTASLRGEGGDDRIKFINRNLELALCWDEYDQDRKRILGQYLEEKLQKARLTKESMEEEERTLKIVRAKRWETFKEH